MIINSILDTDLYKLTMQQAVLEHYPTAQVSYVFKDRGQIEFPNGFCEALREAVDEMANLRLTDAEYQFLKSKSFFKPGYLEFLRNYRFNPAEVVIRPKIKSSLGEMVEIEIKGLWTSAILWEVPLMALICELKYQMCGELPASSDLSNFKTLTKSKGQAFTDARIKTSSPMLYTDFGTRRRRSHVVQDTLIETLKSFPGFFGTSNPYFAMKHGLRCTGTMAHEWIMGHSALKGLRYANRYALEAWSQTYRGDNGIALTDTFGSDAFFEDFDLFNSKLFDGIRHDSGDPKTFVNKAFDHYESLRIPTSSKLLVFSDGLNTNKAIELYHYCCGNFRTSFGIGTHFTNDFSISPPLNIVIKLNTVNGIPVVKISDSPGKAIGDRDALRVAKWTFFKTPLDAA